MAWSQSTDEPMSSERLRVGLVLGGGGARGAAHIGVLKELERLQIPVDAIAGTSMGAIVGGLYAMGMNAEELEVLVSSLDWTAALTDHPDRADVSFRRKQDDRAFPIDFELGVRGSELLLPKGVIQGQKLDLLLRELTLDVSHISDFDELPIPFRAIAADIVVGEAVVLDSGDLSQAIRASMSVPGVFAPTRIGERTLVDGGLIGNLPVDVMRNMGVDVIIAVDVEFPLYGAEELESVVAISEQMLTILIRKETLRQIDSMSDSDVLVRPELGTYASTNFAEITETIEPGQLAARGQQSRLQELSLSNEEWIAHIAARNDSVQRDQQLAFVRVVHDGKLSPRVLESRLSIEAGDPVDAAVLADNANRLYGLQLYEQVGYKLVEEDGRTGVEYTATSKSWGPNFLQFGISLEDDLEGSTSFNLAARMTRAGINRLGAEWRTDVQLGTDPTLFSEFYQPLSFDSRFFIAPRLQTGQSNLNVFDSEERVARYRLTENHLGLDLGRELGTIGELRIGAFRGNGSARVNVGDPSFPNDRFQRGGVFARLRIDTQDSAQFARKGSLVDIRWNKSLSGMGADFASETLQGEVSQTWSRGKNSLQLGLSYGTTLSATNNVQDYLPLGGFLRLSGLERGEISGPHSGLARLVYYRRVGDTTGGLFETPIYFGISAEAGTVWQSRSEINFDSMQTNGSIFAGVDSFFGPVFLAAGYAENGQTNFYLFIGEPPR
ncbi:MAG: patatin-like phospholipase family protein [Gammaproteobacteria bacterium]|nr:patatin-like phospholipase family protein [Gammaproteobacteria bacterium]